MIRPIIAGCLLCLALIPSAQAIILFGKTNTENITDPETGVPWDAIGRVTGGTDISGSAVHLGNGYMLTADHVQERSKVTFDGTTFYNRDTSFTPVQVADGVDMKIFKLTETPSVSAVNLPEDGTVLSSAATLIGWGRGRDSSVPINSTSVTWASTGTVNKRWGQNQPRLLVNGFSYTYGSENYTYNAVVTVLGSSSGVPAGLGANEAAASQFDSGSGLFQFINDEWVLVGLTTIVASAGTSNFGNDFATIVDNSIVTGGDGNFFVHVDSYRSEILAIIPEARYTALAFGMIVLLLCAVTRRRLRLS